MDTKSAADLRKAYKTTVIIGLTLMAGLILYAVVVETIKKQYAPFQGYAPLPEDTAATFRFALVAITVAEFFIIRILNKMILSAKGPVITGPGAGQYGPEVQRLMTASVVTFALCESVAIYGLVLFLIQGNSDDFYLFLLVSLFYFSIFFPKYGAWEAWMKGREKARRP
jgi:F0F1-type ATP synthase membrane subunit c/vacuolar-type H+-ATPase subunit K